MILSRGFEATRTKRPGVLIVAFAISEDWEALRRSSVKCFKGLVARRYNVASAVDFHPHRRSRRR